MAMLPDAVEKRQLQKVLGLPATPHVQASHYSLRHYCRSLLESLVEETCLHLEISAKGEDLLIGQTALAGAQKSYIKTGIRALNETRFHCPTICGVKSKSGCVANQKHMIRDSQMFW
ncbi:hypothetical protein AAES_158422 [Amazona aestiva]|uniref:Uncharacterized protein n=1 Tax=Amazona aestiva TaxID=12930 RepID=A0A0Q3LUZ8_AMAAE|nr:hypothetical protein AAES_158422 [Amazona aestiva]